MKIVLIFGALVAVAVAAPQDVKPTPVAFLQYDEKHDDAGQFSISYETADGIKVTRQGVLKPNANGTDFVLVQSGSQIYTAPDGSVIRLTWFADENGYNPTGDHLPVAPSASAPSAA